jgi:NAD(P)-dependent dehydrogenase (short-subunit alcohol dehydrogenase family)
VKHCRRFGPRRYVVGVAVLDACVVTGSASGIGLAVVECLLSAGWFVAGLDRHGQPDHAGSDHFAAVAGDVSDQDSHHDAAVAAEQGGRLRGWVNNAGIIVAESAAELTEFATRRQLDVNVLGTAWGCAEAVQRFLAHGEGGAIVNTSSVQAIRSVPGTFVYAGTKGAIDAMTRQVAIEYATSGIRANSVLPGAILTPLNEKTFAAQADPALARDREAWLAPMGRLGTPAEVAELIGWLITSAPAFLTGQAIGIDGGAAARLKRYSGPPE